MNREEWLTQIVHRLMAPEFDAASVAFEPDKIRIACGFPKASDANRVLGQCWAYKLSKGGLHELFISPVEDDAGKVCGTIKHELCHVVAGVEAGHKKGFIKVAKAVKLERGQGWKYATSSEEEIELYRQKAKDMLGEYPHKALALIAKVTRQKTRMIKCTCSTCGYSARTTRVWLDAAGAPICPADETQMEEQE